MAETVNTTLSEELADEKTQRLIKCLRRVASVEFSPAFQSREDPKQGSRRVATPENRVEFTCRYATRKELRGCPGVRTPG